MFISKGFMAARYSTRSVTKWAVSAVTVFSLVGITGAAPAVAKDDMTFGYVVASLVYPFNASTAKGFEDAAKEKGVKTVVLDPQGSVEKQGNAIDDLLAQKVDAIGFLPIESMTSQSFVDKVVAAGIPIVACCSQVGDASHDVRDVYKGLNAATLPDEVAEGEASGKLAARLVPKDKTIKLAVIEGPGGFAGVEKRTRGFTKGLEENGIKYEIVGHQPTDWTPEQGEAVCQNFLTANPDIDLFFSQADDMALGCSRAITAVGSKAKLVATFGGSKLGNEAIKNGELDGSTCVKPGTLGKLMFQAMYEAATGANKDTGRVVLSPVLPLTKDNLDQCVAEW